MHGRAKSSCASLGARSGRPFMGANLFGKIGFTHALHPFNTEHP